MPFKFLPVAVADPVPEDSAWRDVAIKVESVPEVAEPGTALRFTVAITNESQTAADPAEQCPSYFMSFGESAEAAIPGLSRLNCEEATAIAPGEVERFAMAIELPSEFDLDNGSVYWRLEPTIVDASSPPIPVAGASP